VVNVECGFRQQIPQRVIADTREMSDRVDAVEIGGRQLSDISALKRGAAGGGICAHEF